MKKLIAALLILACPALAQAQNPIKQSGTVTPGHVPYWVTNGVIGDAGTAANGKLTSLGITASGPSFCINSAAITSAGWQQFCFGATTANGGTISIQNFGTAAAKPFIVTVNGTPYQFPFSLSGILGPNSSTIGHLAVWNNTIGTLLSDQSFLSLMGVSLCTTQGAFPVYNSTSSTWQCSTAAATGQAAIINGDPNQSTSGATLTVNGGNLTLLPIPSAGGPSATEIPALWLSGSTYCPSGDGSGTCNDTIALLDSYGTISTPAILFRKSGGTFGSPAATGDQNVLGNICSLGFYAGPVSTSQSACIQFLSDGGTFTSTSWPTSINLYTTPLNAIVPVLRLTIGSTGTITQTLNALGGTTVTAGYTLKNATSAGAGAQQISPSTVWLGQGWATNAGGSSQSVAIFAEVVPVQGTANPSGLWILSHQINAGSITRDMSVSTAGVLDAASGFSSGGTAGLSATVTVRASGGGSDCTLIFTGGIKTGGSC